MRVERMRQAILQGVPLDLAFAKPSLPPMSQQQGPPQFGGGGPPGFYHPQPGLNFRPNQPLPAATGAMGGPPMGYGAYPGRGANQQAQRGRGLLGDFGD